jgi:non-specific serine/threonine protein kinase
MEPVAELPLDRTSYVGRDEELAIAKRMLASGPVVTLIGPGGVGKTRLAASIGAAARLGFPDGVVFVELAELRVPQLLANTVADRLGLFDQSTRPTVEVVIEYLRSRRMLLVLDNCEHLIEPCARFVSGLVAACPQLVVLTTSRQSLGISGERLMLVPPLAVPGIDTVETPQDATKYDAVRLLVDRATAVLPSFSITKENCKVVARLCRDLEGLPLAIELAAVRLRSLSLSQITDRLSRSAPLLSVGRRTGPLRQQTLHALIDWSYQLCSPLEQLVWTRASVFSGTFDVDAAEHVCGGAGVDPGDVLDVVDALLDKSMLVREEQNGLARYRMLETLRLYGNDRLEESGDRPRVRRAHRDWYADMVARSQAEWVGRHQIAWVERLRRDHANLRVALDYCITEPGEATVALEMVTHLDLYWGIRGAHTEARLWVSRAVPAASARAPQWVAALRLGGWFALIQGDIEGGVKQLVKAGELVEETGDKVQGAWVTLTWGMAALFTGNEARSRDLFGEALAVFTAHQVPLGRLYAAFAYGLATAVSGDVDKGRALLRETIAECEELGEIFWRSYALWALASVELLYGDIDDCERAAVEALRLTQLINNRLAEAFLMTIIAGVAQLRNQHELTAQLYGVSDSMWAALGADPYRYGMFGTERREREQITRQAIGDAKMESFRAKGAAMPREDGMRLALGEPIETPRAQQVGKQGPLTKRETEIAQLIAEGMTNREIAAKLFIAPRTADTHVDHILTKLGVNNRAQVATWITSHD